MLVLLTSATADVLSRSLLWSKAHTSSEGQLALLLLKLDGILRYGEWRGCCCCCCRCFRLCPPERWQGPMNAEMLTDE